MIASDDARKQMQTKQTLTVAASDETLLAARRETVKDIGLPVLPAFFILMGGTICRFVVLGFFSILFLLSSCFLSASDVTNIARRPTV